MKARLEERNEKDISTIRAQQLKAITHRLMGDRKKRAAIVQDRRETRRPAQKVRAAIAKKRRSWRADLAGGRQQSPVTAPVIGRIEGTSLPINVGKQRGTLRAFPKRGRKLTRRV